MTNSLELLTNPNTPTETLILFAEKNENFFNTLIAEHPNTPPEVLTRFAEDEDDGIRRSVAQNPNTPPDVLAKLVKYKEWDIHTNIASNPSTPPEVLAKLAEEEDYQIRVSVAENPNTSPETLTRLVEQEYTESITIPLALTENLNTPAKALITINNVYPNDPAIYESLNQHPNFFQYRAEQDGICEVGQQLPVEWLKEIYSTTHNML